MCKTCPWRLDARASEIPNFNLDLAEGLVSTISGQYGAPIMACHQSKPEQEIPCAGWLAVHGWHSIAVRLKLIDGSVTADALTPGEDWPEIHTDYPEVLEKLRRTL